MGEDDAFVKAVLIVLRNLKLQYKIHIPCHTEEFAKRNKEYLENNGIDSVIEHDVHKSAWDVVIR